MAQERNKDLVDALHREEFELVKRLKATRNAIVGFGGTLSNDLIHSLLELDEKPDVVKKPPIEVPSEYDESLSVIQKIAFALQQLGGEGYVTEIAEKISELDESARKDEEGLKKSVTAMTSYLYKEGRIDARKEGNRYKYQIRTA
jgi:hypothetical protein